MHRKCAVVWECLQDLPDSHRNVLLLRGVQELDTNETAEALGVSPGCTKVRLHRARRALRALLAERSEPRAVFKSLPSGRHAGLGQLSAQEVIMRSATPSLDSIEPESNPVQTLTLLDLVAALADSGMRDNQVVRAVAWLVNSGRVSLVGQFRGARIQVTG